jgi:hypothetical protein
MKSFSQINTDDLKQLFGIETYLKSFVPTIEPMAVPSWLDHIVETRRKNLISIRTEKATSESLIAPILMAIDEIYTNKITVFSGEPLSTGELSGVCDFIITKGKSFEPKGGYLVLVEAKKQDLLSGVPQCIAEMYAAQQLNGNDDTVYGCVSTGLEWIFLKLEDKIATTDPNIFAISEVPKILGVFGWIIGN